MGLLCFCLLDIHGSVHHSIIHIKNPTRCNSVSKLNFMFIWSSTCFGPHTAHHKEPKTALAAFGFAYMEGCWTCSWWTLSGTVWEGAVLCTWQRPPTTRPTTFYVCKARGCWCSIRLLMIGGVSPETCWASYKYEIKFWHTVAFCWIFYMNYFLFIWSSKSHRDWMPCICAAYHYIIQHMHSVLHHLWHISTPTCFGLGVPSSGRYIYKPTWQSVFCPSL
jgi:hypothetical protein